MNIAKMEADYTATLEDIAAMDENLDSTVKDYFSGTGTLWQNELYAKGRTTETNKDLSIAFRILKEELHKRAILVKQLKKVYPNMDLEAEGYEELLYLTAGLYNRKKLKES